MPTISLAPTGPFSLASSVRFLMSFTPASYNHAPDDILRLAFPADDATSVLAATVRQEMGPDGVPGTVQAELTAHPGTPTPEKPATAEPTIDRVGRTQLARILSLDVDGSGFPALGADPVMAGLMARHPGLRPVCFHSPYEAAAWAIIGNRIRKTQAAAIKARITREYGQRIHVSGHVLHAFPTPTVLRTLPPPAWPDQPQGPTAARAGRSSPRRATRRRPSAQLAGRLRPRRTTRPARHRPLLRRTRPHPGCRTPGCLPPPRTTGPPGHRRRIWALRSGSRRRHPTVQDCRSVEALPQLGGLPASRPVRGSAPARRRATATFKSVLSSRRSQSQ